LGNDARKGKWMEIFFAILALCAFAPGAHAAGTDCRRIESDSVRLACYDAASPATFGKPKGIEKGIEKTVEKDAARSEYKDPFLAEEARTTAKLNNICRGC
jgi:hypothetical protein